MTGTVASKKAELHSLVELLSEYECGHLLSAVSDAAAGERFWERDVGIMYNEYVKARYFDLSRNLSSLVPAGPVYDDEPFVPIPLVKSYPAATRVVLPDASGSARPTTDSIVKRRSRRDYAPEPLTAGQLSSLLHFAAGVTGFVQGYGYRRWPLRSFPSSGGLQTPELYVFVRDVEGLRPGLYHYQPLDHVLELLTDTYDGGLLAAIGLGQPYIQTAPVVFAITGYYARASWKYGERAFRYMCMDVGFLGQNLYLVAEALGLGACAIAGFIDDALERLLGVDSHEEMAFLMCTIGPLVPATSDPVRERPGANLASE